MTATVRRYRTPSIPFKTPRYENAASGPTVLWDFTAAGRPDRLLGQTLGIVGLGRIGSEVARMATGLGLRVIATDPAVDPAHAATLGVDLVSPTELFARSDIVSNHMNGTADNQGYFDAAAFAAMTRRPIFCNTARGSAVVEADLVAALDAGQIRAAGLDVLHGEGAEVTFGPLAGRSDVVLTPHAAFYTAQSIRALMEVSCANLVGHVTGGRVNTYVVHP